MTEKAPDNPNRQEQPAYPPLALDLAAKAHEGLEQARRGRFVDGEECFARWKARLVAATKEEPVKGY